jgi:hypothetical protein
MSHALFSAALMGGCRNTMTASALPGWCRVVEIQQQRLLTPNIAVTSGATGRCY